MVNWGSSRAEDKIAALGSLFGGGSPPPPAEDPSGLLGSLGLQWVSGNGDNAVWQLPDGRRVTEGAALDMALGAYDASGKRISAPTGIDTTPKPDASSAGATTKEIGGRVVQWNPTSQRYDIDLGPSGAGGGGMTAGQASEAAARNAQLQETMRVNSATIDRNGRLDALAQQQQAWLQQKETLARADHKDDVANQTAMQLAGIQTQRDRLQLDTQVAQQQAVQAQRTLDFNIQNANSQNALAVSRANNEAEAQKRRDIADVNEKLGVLGQDTGNRGRFAAFAAANKGWGADNTAIGQGTSLIDSSSVQPLEASLVNKQAIEARPDRPYLFNPIAGMSGGPLSNGMRPGYEGTPYSDPNRGIGTAQQIVNGQLMDYLPGQSGLQNVGQAAAQPAGTDYSDAAMQARITASRAAGSGAGGQGTNGQPAFLPQMEHGGTVQGAFMAGDSSDGEENPEIVIPLGAGGAMVVSTRGMSPAKVKALKQHMVKFATGGLFDQLGDDAKLSKGFLEDASKKFREGTPWAGMPGALPSPVYGSSPGFSPLLNSLLASGRALEQGIPTEYSSWLTDRYRPDTIRGINSVSRSG